MLHQFSLNQQQQADITKCIEAVKQYRSALDKAYLNGEVNFIIASNCNLFFTLDCLEEILAGKVWDLSIGNLDGECRLLDDMLNMYPEEFKAVEDELKGIHDAFKSFKMLKIA